MMNDLIKQDEQARLLALDPMRSFIVQAPAGSGKTELLTQRYLKLLSSLQRGPEEIIAVTFTKKAAAQMRSRIVNALIDAKTNSQAPELAHVKLTWQLAKEALEHCEKKHWDIIAYPNQLRILTIDALCSHLTSRMPILSNFGASPEISTQPEFLYQKAVNAFMEYFKNNTNPGHDHKFFKILLKQVDNRLELAESLMIDMLGKRDQWLGHMTQLKVQKHNKIVILEEGLQRVIITHLERCHRAFKKLSKEKDIFLRSHYCPNHPVFLLLNDTRLPEPVLNDLPLWLTLQDLLMTKEGEFRKVFTMRHGFLAPSKARNKQEREERLYYKQIMEDWVADLSQVEGLKLALQALHHLPPPKLSFEQINLIEALTELLPLLTAHLILQFKEAGTVDFIEVALRAVVALGEEGIPTDLALSLDYQLRHLLIDEFQDTSFAQFHLFEKLVAGWGPSEGRTLFLVGDPMQSIYRFRGAEVGLFLQVQQEGLNQVELTPLRLTKNFRSRQGIVEWINHYFQSIFPAVEDRHLGAVTYAPAVSGIPEVNTQQDIYFYSDSDEKSKNLAQLILKLWHLTEASGESIAILVRARHHLDYLLPLLRQLSIPFEAHDIEALGLKQSILDLLSLTQALTDLSDTIAWLAILRAPWCGLKLEDLTILASEYAQSTVWSALLKYKNLNLSHDALERLDRILPIFEHWLYHRQRHRLSAWIKGIWLALGGPACYAEICLSHAQVFFELLDKESAHGYCLSMVLFEKKLGKLLARGHLSAPVPAGRQAVQLMTIHKAKGLEFDIVIVPSLEKTNRPTQSELLIWYERKHKTGIDLIIAPRKAQHQSSDSLYQHVNAELALKADLENARLLYVALTRAKKQIHLWGYVCELSPPSGSFLSYLWPKIQADRAECETKSPEISKETVLPGVPLMRCLTRLGPPMNIPEIIQNQDDLNHPNESYNIDKITGILINRILQSGELPVLSSIPSWKVALMRLGIKPQDMQTALKITLNALSSVVEEN